jgi:hypothetical protein
MQCGGLAVCVAANGRVSDDWLSIFIVVWLAGGRAGDIASMPVTKGRAGWMCVASCGNRLIGALVG